MTERSRLIRSPEYPRRGIEEYRHGQEGKDGVDGIVKSDFTDVLLSSVYCVGIREGLFEKRCNPKTTLPTPSVLRFERSPVL